MGLGVAAGGRLAAGHGAAFLSSLSRRRGGAAAAQPVSLKWTDFTGGLCKPNVLPEQIVSISWQFAWSTATTPYDVDIHIDNLQFTKQ